MRPCLMLTYMIACSIALKSIRKVLPPFYVNKNVMLIFLNHVISTYIYLIETH